jgi:hypothetical protein
MYGLAYWATAVRMIDAGAGEQVTLEETPRGDTRPTAARAAAASDWRRAITAALAEVQRSKAER